MLDHHQVGGVCRRMLLPSSIPIVRTTCPVKDTFAPPARLSSTLVQVVRELRERGAGGPPPDLLGYLDLEKRSPRSATSCL